MSHAILIAFVAAVIVVPPAAWFGTALWRAVDNHNSERN